MQALAAARPQALAPAAVARSPLASSSSCLLARPAVAAMRLQQQRCGHRLQRRAQAAGLRVVATYPEPETEKERSPIDFPQEWITPQPSRRPDIFPEFERLQTPMPKPMPGDPEMPDEEEEEEKEKKPDKEDPDEDKPKPDEPAPSEE